VVAISHIHEARAATVNTLSVFHDSKRASDPPLKKSRGRKRPESIEVGSRGEIAVRGKDVNNCQPVRDGMPVWTPSRIRNATQKVLLAMQCSRTACSRNAAAYSCPNPSRTRSVNEEAS
jgi:hypothetical protein